MATFQLKFNGPSVVLREITVKQAKQHGFILKEDVRLRGGAAVLLEDPDQTAIDYFKDEDDEFSIREVGKEQAEADASK